VIGQHFNTSHRIMSIADDTVEPTRRVCAPKEKLVRGTVVAAWSLVSNMTNLERLLSVCATNWTRRHPQKPVRGRDQLDVSTATSVRGQVLKRDQVDLGD
jgi:hypothetical protein